MAYRIRLFTKGADSSNTVWMVILLACTAPHLNPRPGGLFPFGIGFSFLLLRRDRLPGGLAVCAQALCPGIGQVILYGFKSISVFCLPPSAAVSGRAAARHRRIASWDERPGSSEMKRNNNKGSQTRLKMMDLIASQDGYLLYAGGPMNWYPNLGVYPCPVELSLTTTTFDKRWRHHFIGSVIFSRFPIIDSGISVPGPVCRRR